MRYGTVIITFLLCTAFLRPMAQADDTYAPPPMFGGSATPAPQKLDQPRAISPAITIEKKVKIAPKAKPESNKTRKPVQPAIKTAKKIISKKVITAASPPPPDKKPAVITKQKFLKKDTKSHLEPIDIIQDSRAPVTQVEKPKGVVTGPKTMPAIPKEQVASEVIFTDPNKEFIPLIEKTGRDLPPQQEEKSPTSSVVYDDALYPEEEIHLFFYPNKNDLITTSEAKLDHLKAYLPHAPLASTIIKQEIASPLDVQKILFIRRALSHEMQNTEDIDIWKTHPPANTVSDKLTIVLH